MNAATETPRIDPYSLIKKSQNTRIQWDQDYEKNYKVFAVKLANKTFLDVKAEYEKNLSNPYVLRHTFKRSIVLNIFEDEYLRDFTKKINLEPFISWVSTNSVTNKLDNKYFTHCLQTIGGIAVHDLRTLLTNYLTNNFECSIQQIVPDYEEEDYCIEINISIKNISQLALHSKVPNQIDFSVMVKHNEIRHQWQLQFNENHQAYASKLATAIFYGYKLDYERNLQDPYVEPVKIKGEFKRYYMLNIFSKDRAVGKVAQSTKLEPFYQWNNQPLVKITVDNKYFNHLMTRVGKVAVPLLCDEFKKYFTTDFNFKISLENNTETNAAKENEETMIQISTWLVTDPTQLKKQSVTVIDKYDPNLLVKKNN